MHSDEHKNRVLYYDLTFCDPVGYETDKLKGGYKPENYTHSFDSDIFRIGYTPENYIQYWQILWFGTKHGFYGNTVRCYVYHG